jgi:hypothetical protein
MARGIGAIGGVGYIGVSFGLAMACHRINRQLFDDEVLTLAGIDGKSLVAVGRYYLEGGDVHPPLSFLWFRLLQELGLSLDIQRAISFVLAAAAFAFALDLVWKRLWRRSLGTELIALTLFFAVPLLYGAGDALRWYPLFSFLIAAAFWRVFDAGRPTLAAAVLLGLAADTSYLAALPALAYAIWRYAIERRLDPLRDFAFWVVAAIVAVPGLISFFAARHLLTSQLAASPLVSIGTDVMGLSGGTILGVSQSVVAIPLAIVFVIGLISAFAAPGRGYGGDVRGFGGLLILGAVAVMLLGHDKPRSFLFLMPWTSAVAVLGVAAWRRPLALAGPAIAAGIVAVAFQSLAGPHNDRPFKRNAAIPIEAVVSYVQGQSHGRSLIVSAEPVSGYMLAHGNDASHCVYVRSLAGPCRLDQFDDFNTVILIDDGSLQHDPAMARLVDDHIRTKALAEQQRFGHDLDAGLKTRLTGVDLPDYLIDVLVYRLD